MLNKILDIIKELNNGNIFLGIKDKDCQIETNSSLVKCFITENKSYFFAELKYSKEEKGNNSKKIEDQILATKKIALDTNEEFKQFRPSNSYLIYFFETPKINESTFSRVIEFEENIYLFKKYVFYYTQEEFLAFSSFYNDKIELSKSNLNDIIEILSKEAFDYNDPAINFLIKLIIKIPFFKINFPKLEYVDFEEIYKNKIKASRMVEDINNLDSLLNDEFSEHGSENLLSIVNNLFIKFVED